MKYFIFFFYLIALTSVTWAASTNKDTDLSFEGKASALISRNISVPFPVLVDKALVGIGDNVHKDEHLLKFQLEPNIERTYQHELLTSGGQLDRNLEQNSLSVDIAASANRRKLSSELAAKGLGSNEENAQNGRQLNLLQKRMSTLREKDQIAKLDFSYRLQELEKYFGQKLKGGQKLPQELFMISTIDGTVINMSPQARPGGRLEGVAFTIGVLNPIQVSMQVHESEITKLHVGQPVTVQLGNDEKKQFKGEIIKLSWQPIDATIAVPSFYIVWVDVENPDHIIKPGYKVIVHVQSDTD